MMRRARSPVFALGVAVGVSACSSGTATPSAPSAGAGNTSQLSAGGAASAAAGSVGVNASAGGSGSSSVGGASPSGGAISSGGISGNGSAGEAGAGMAGAAQAGSAGVANDFAAAAILNGYQLLDPCQSSYHAVATPGDVCPQDTAVKNQKIQLQFGGEANVTYNVTLRVRGIMEGYWYSGGTLDATSKTFYTGGVPTVGGYGSACKNKTSELPFALPPEITPTDNCWNGFNMFALTVSAPKQHYYLNYTAEQNGDRPPHAVYTSDYTVTIPIQGQAALEFYIIGSDEHECYNFNGLVTGVSTTPTPYVGDFVQLDVRNVMRAP